MSVLKALVAAVVLIGGLWNHVFRQGLDGHELFHLGYLSQIRHGALLQVDTLTNYGWGFGYLLYWGMIDWSVAAVRLSWSLHVIALLALAWGLTVPRLRSLASRLFFVLAVPAFTLVNQFIPTLSGHTGYWGWANPMRYGWIPLILIAHKRAWLTGLLLAAGCLYEPTSASIGVVCVGLLWWMTRARDWWHGALTFVLAATAGTAPIWLRGDLAPWIENCTLYGKLALLGGANTPFPWGWYAVLLVGLLVLLYAARRWGDPLTYCLVLSGALAAIPVIQRASPYTVYQMALGPLMGLSLMIDRLFNPRAALVLAIAPAFMLLGQRHHRLPENPTVAMSGIWVAPDTTWFSSHWNHADVTDHPEAVGLIQKHLPEQGRALILGPEQALWYFLTKAKAASKHTDFSATRVTRARYYEVTEELTQNPPDVIVVGEKWAGVHIPSEYRLADEAHGMVIYRRRTL